MTRNFSGNGSRFSAQTAVPTAAMWNGDFSNATDTSGNKVTIYNPYTTNAQGLRQPFPGNVIPQNLLNAKVINAFKSITPLPSGPNAGANPWIGNNFQAYYPNTTNTNTLTADAIRSSRKRQFVGRVSQTVPKLTPGRREFLVIRRRA